MIRQFLEGCHVLGALAFAGLVFLGCVLAASFLTRVFGRKTQPNTRKP